ncbi:hypothetical protein EDC96DRAFT_556022 [Choanephora cucurbitarum]|nr:hypothetical protein EDC96DRAFT_556022 [Choanephora cucurbitarum]
MNKRLSWKFSKRSSKDEETDRIHRTESTSSYMQQRRRIYVNMKPPASDYDEKGRLIGHSYVPNRVRTAKYTPLSFIPKNLFEQFRNVANLYFLFLVILQCFPIFGVVEPAVFHAVHVLLGFFCMLAGIDNRFTHTYRMALAKKPNKRVELDFDRPLNQVDENTTEENQTKNHLLPLSLHKIRKHSGTFRTDMNGLFKSSAGKQIYRPGIIPHSVLHRTTTASIRRRSSSVHINTNYVQVGDYVMIRNDEDVPADIIILSTSEMDNLCYVETQNLDGETNLKVRQGLKATGELRTVHDCERAYFYFESEPPNVNLYQYNGPDDESTVTHQKTEAVTYNNLLLRGCVLRNTRWAIGVIVYTGAETKIMLNSGSTTPSKRSSCQFLYFGYSLYH